MAEVTLYKDLMDKLTLYEHRQRGRILKMALSGGTLIGLVLAYAGVPTVSCVMMPLIAPRPSRGVLGLEGPRKTSMSDSNRIALLSIAKGAQESGRFEEAHKLELEAYGMSTEEPKERHGYDCGQLPHVVITYRACGMRGVP
jgi:hypothetical protein